LTAKRKQQKPARIQAVENQTLDSIKTKERLRPQPRLRCPRKERDRQTDQVAIQKKRVWGQLNANYEKKKGRSPQQIHGGGKRDRREALYLVKRVKPVSERIQFWRKEKK